MKHLSNEDRGAIARQLELMKRETLDELRANASPSEREAATGAPEVHSNADEAEAGRVGDLRLAAIEIDRERLKAIEQAQQRLADGHYGICVDCGEEIAPGRLLAQPIAIRCAACQQALETRRR